MRKIEDYMRHAVECRRMANVASSEENREGLLEMARTWESLATQREHQLARQERLTSLDTTAD
jgi:hypothetical protein